MILKITAAILGIIVLSSWVLMWVNLFLISDSSVMIAYLFGSCFALHVIPFVVVSDNVLKKIKDRK